MMYFLLKYIPFWAVPIGMISAEFAYRYWLKSLKKVAILFGSLSFFCGIMIIYYFVVGGPDHAVTTFGTWAN